MKLFIETFGCQMNFSDSEIIASVMGQEGYTLCSRAADADVVFINTCAIRDNAEQRVRKRLRELSGQKKKRPEMLVGVLGCMAERMKEQLLDEELVVDLIAGPDSYRELPALLLKVSTGQRLANVMLSEEETYSDLEPVRFTGNGVSAFISIMRGCTNFCAYCVVPYTRGRERSRDIDSILAECRDLVAKGYKEVTLLGQNVNSYQHLGATTTDFPDLLEAVAVSCPELRIRFATSHPKDLSDKLIHVMACYPNICNHIHLPAQSGSNEVLHRMNRKYTREWYLGRVDALRKAIPDIGLSTDLIAGFCGETDEDHQQTLSLMKACVYDFAFMFAYSERPGTNAAENLPDDVPSKEKKRRLNEIITLQQELSHKSNLADIGKTFPVLVEGVSKKSDKALFGRTPQNKVVVFPATGLKPGTEVQVLIKECTTATLLGEMV